MVKNYHMINDSRVAQRLARWAHNSEVGGSKPLSANFFSFSRSINQSNKGTNDRKLNQSIDRRNKRQKAQSINRPKEQTIESSIKRYVASKWSNNAPKIRKSVLFFRKMIRRANSQAKCISYLRIVGGNSEGSKVVKALVSS